MCGARGKVRAEKIDRQEGDSDASGQLFDAVRNAGRRGHVLLGEVLQRKEVQRRERKSHAEAAQIEYEEDMSVRGVERETAGEPETQRHDQNARRAQQQRPDVAGQITRNGREHALNQHLRAGTCFPPPAPCIPVPAACRAAADRCRRACLWRRASARPSKFRSCVPRAAGSAAAAPGLRSSATMNHASAAPATMKQPITSGALHPPGFDGELPRASA